MGFFQTGSGGGEPLRLIGREGENPKKTHRNPFGDDVSGKDEIAGKWKT